MNGLGVTDCFGSFRRGLGEEKMNYFEKEGGCKLKEKALV